MAFAFVQEFEIEDGKRTTADYDAVNERLTQADAPDGLVIHYAGFDPSTSVFRVVNVWQTREQGQEYHDNFVMPAIRDVVDGPQKTPVRESVYELHHVALP